MKRSLQLMSGGGLQINGKHTYCGDYIYSGHTLILVLSYLTVKECESVYIQWNCCDRLLNVFVLTNLWRVFFRLASPLLAAALASLAAVGVGHLLHSAVARPLHRRRHHRLLCDDAALLAVSHDGQQPQPESERSFISRALCCDAFQITRLC